MKIEKFELPVSVEQIVGLFGRIITNLVDRVVVDFVSNHVEVLWSPQSNGESLVIEEDLPVEVQELFNHIRISEFSGEVINYHPHAALTLMSALQELTGERLVPHMIVCSDIGRVKRWLGLPAALPLPTLCGVSVAEHHTISEDALYVLCARFYGATSRAVSAIRRIPMKEAADE
jgi:hypothetical protein